MIEILNAKKNETLTTPVLEELCFPQTCGNDHNTNRLRKIEAPSLAFVESF